MQRTKFSQQTGVFNELDTDKFEESDIELLCEQAFSNDAHFKVNKSLLQRLGPMIAIYLTNLIDKQKYFREHKMLREDGSFFLTHESQIGQLGFSSEYTICQCKKVLKDEEILETIMVGCPPKEYYKISMKRIFGIIRLASSHSSEPQPNIRANLNRTELETSTEYTIITKKNKDNKNKLQDIPANTLASGQESSDEKPSSKNKIDPFIPTAKYLAEIIELNKNVKHTPKQVEGWAYEIYKLVHQTGVSRTRIRVALDWYRKHIGEEFVPIIESGRSLHEKFLRLEDAIDRDSNGSKRRQKSSLSPEEIVKTRLNGNSTRIIEDCLFPAIRFSNGTSSEKIADAICDLFEYISRRQKRPIYDAVPKYGEIGYGTYCNWRDLIPYPQMIIKQYIEWLHEEKQIAPSPNLLRYDNSYFSWFLTDLKRSIACDPFTGESA